METDQARVSLVQIFASGGVFMWPILVLSVLAVAFLIERSVAVILFHRRSEGFIRYLQSRGSAGSPAFDGLGERIFALGRSEADRLIGEALQPAFERTGRPLPLLAGIGATAPILGFLGTVSGMIASFRSIAQADRVSVRLVAGGISEALVTTGFGLIVAVICIVTEHFLRYYLVSRAHRLEEETDIFLSRRVAPKGAGTAQGAAEAGAAEGAAEAGGAHGPGDAAGQGSAGAAQGAEGPGEAAGPGGAAEGPGAPRGPGAPEIPPD